MNNKEIQKSLKTAAIAIRSSGNLGAFSFFIPLVLLFSLPLGFVAIWRKNKVMKNPAMVDSLKELTGVKKKQLHTLKKEDSMKGAAALFLIHKNSAYNPFVALIFWVVVFIVFLSLK